MFPFSSLRINIFTRMEVLYTDTKQEVNIKIGKDQTDINK